LTDKPKPKRKNKRADQARAMGELLRLSKALSQAQAGVAACSRYIGRAQFDLAASLGREAIDQITRVAFPLLAQSAHDPDATTRQAAWRAYQEQQVWIAARLRQAAGHYASAVAAQARRTA